MSRPAKPVAVLQAEGKSHRTKAELEHREQAEKALLSGTEMFERDAVKNDPAAHNEFVRLRKLLAAIGMNDALYASVCNRYCELFAECEYYKREISRLRDMVKKLESLFDEKSDEADYDDVTNFAKQITALLKQINSMDSAVMHKRKMMFDIEKENVMTVSSAQRSIPKTPTDSNDDALLKALLS